MDRSVLKLSLFHTCPLPNNFSEVEGCGAALASIFDPANADIVLAGSEMAGSRYQKYRMTE
jgi:hypothetical protein